jgi:excinuclease ABC subunit B
VSLVAILDADKEGFLRNFRSLTQTAGRAARNSNGKVLFYADKLTDSMKKTIDESERRRTIQIAYNTQHHITPLTVSKSRSEILKQSSVLGTKAYIDENSDDDNVSHVVADPVVQYMSQPQLEKAIQAAKASMQQAAKNQDFMTAAQHRDELFALQKLLKTKFGA